MRAEHLTAVDIQAYAARTLSARDALEISDHLLLCAECRALVAQAERFRSPARGPVEISYEEMADLIDGKLDPLERRELRDKLERSPRARAELEDLARFKREVTVEAGRQPAHRSRWRVWSLPLAAAIAAGVALLWWNLNAPRHENALVLTDNGLRLQIAPDGSLLGHLEFPPELRTSLQMAFTRNQLEVAPALAALRGHASNLAGPPATSSTLQVLSPVGGVVEQPTPRFRWRAFDGAVRYRVIVARDDSDDVVATGVVENGATEWTPPNPLKRGETYSWQVQALAGGSIIATAPAPPQPEAKFRVLAAAEAEDLEKLRQRIGSSHLALGLAYARAGLIDQAGAEIAALARENPQSSVPARLQAALRNAIASARD